MFIAAAHVDRGMTSFGPVTLPQVFADDRAAHGEEVADAIVPRHSSSIRRSARLQDPRDVAFEVGHLSRGLPSLPTDQYHVASSLRHTVFTHA